MDTVTPTPTPAIEWRRAWHALRALVADSKQTDQVFEIIDALSGASFETSYQRFCAHPEGRRLLAERPSLLATLSNREALRALPPGSFGRAYVDFMESGKLTPEGLVEAEAMAEQRRPRPPADADHHYFGDRIRDMHDLWHVLTGYGMDEAGEAANLAFTHGQIPNRGIAFILLAAVVIGPKDLRFSWARYLHRAWRRGRRAALLTAVRYEDLLSQPLDEVRRLLHIELPIEAHPEGIIVGSRTDEPGNDSPPWNRDWQMQNN